jgi:hypothetical protein
MDNVHERHNKRFFFANYISNQGFGNVNVAKLSLDDLSPDLASTGDPDEIDTEYMHHRQFFTI